MIKRSINFKNRETGAITLLVAVIILIVITLMTLYTHKAVISEQRSASNEFKQAQALEAAQSGIDQFLDRLKTPNGATPGKSFLFTYFNAPDPAAADYKKTNYSLKSDFSSAINAKNYLNETSSNTDTKHNFSPAVANKLQVALSGELPQPKKGSDDISGTTLKQTYAIYLSELAPNRFQIVSRGCADDCTYAEATITREISISEGLTCIAEFNDLLNSIAGASIHGFTNGVAGVNCGNAVAEMGGSDADVAGCSSQCNGANPNFIPNNNPGKNYHKADKMNVDDLFRKYFDTSPENVKSHPKTCTIVGDVTLPFAGATNTPFLAQGCNGTEDIIFITGNLNVNSAAGVIFPGVTKSLIVGGDLNLTGTLSMEGFLFVTGSTSSNAAGSIHIANGNASFGGPVNANASINVTAGTKSRLPSNSGPKSNFRSGSWRDF